MHMVSIRGQNCGYVANLYITEKYDRNCNWDAVAKIFKSFILRT